MELSRNIANLALGHQLSSSDSEKQQQRELSSGYGSESGGDMLREMVKNKDLMRPSPRKKELPRYSSVDSDASEGSTLVSTGSDILDMENGSRRRKARINHHAIRGTISDTEAEIDGVRLGKILYFVLDSLFKPFSTCVTTTTIFLVRKFDFSHIFALHWAWIGFASLA